MENLTNEEIGQKLIDLTKQNLSRTMRSSMQSYFDSNLRYEKKDALSNFKNSYLVRRLMPFACAAFMKETGKKSTVVPMAAKTYFYDKLMQEFSEFYDEQESKYNLPDNVDTAIAIGYYSKEMFELLKQYARNEPDVIAILDAIVASTKTGQFVEPEVY